jgi:ubiquinone/menaquinone biosynthesis C-methylase UbiE
MNAQLARSAQAYWDMTAEKYDQIFPNKAIGQAQREVVWQELSGIFHSGQRVLELNCGTGIDAVRLAEGGVRVLACDISPRMIEVARRRALAENAGKLVDFRVLPTEDIAALKDEGPFEGAFSNFAGLNCVEDVSAVAQSLARLLKPGASVLVCMMGRFFLWETVWYLMHGNLRKATRRFKSGSVGRLNDDATVTVYHRSVGAIARTFGPEFLLRRWRGVGISIPPTHLENWARRHPSALSALTKTDRWLGRIPVLRSLADCVLLHFEYAPKRA